MEKAYRTRVQGFIEATARRIRVEQGAGHIADIVDPDETARALVWLNESYLSDALGRTPTADPATVVDVIERICTATLYGRRPRGRRASAARDNRPRPLK